VNLSGVTNVVDVQCGVVASLWALNPQGQPEPECVAGDLLNADANCDGLPTVSDVQALIAYSVGIGLSAAVDANGNACPDTCDSPPGEIVPGALVVVEVMVNPKLVSDAVGEWFEVKNTTEYPLNMKGMIIRDDAGDQFTVGTDLFVDAGELVVFGRNGDININGGVPVDYVFSGMALSNTEDEIVLLLSGVEIDRLAYGATFPQSVGIAMALDSPTGTSATNDQALYWCAAETPYGLGDFGTPGVDNGSCFQCGNGALEPGEECDNGPQNSDTVANACRTNCNNPSCGDAVCDSSETCASCTGDCGPCGPALCGGTRCRADQNCVANTCTFACSGAQVPGDYASIQGAINALAPVGGTICVKPGTYTENLSLNNTAQLSIVGASAHNTTLAGSVTVGFASGTGTLALRGFTINQGISVVDADTNHPISLTALRVLPGASPSANGLTVRRDVRRPQVTVDGCDITGGPSGAAISVNESADFSSLNEMSVVVLNSYLHDAAVGARYTKDAGAANWGTAKLELRNNTLVDNGTALQISGSNIYGNFRYFNNIFADSQVGVNIATDSNSTVQSGSNSYSGNGVNLSGNAVFGANDSTALAQLSGLVVPPEPTATSPAIGTALVSQAPALDYWAEQRDSTPDRGAVEFLCSAPPCVATGPAACGNGTCAGGETCASCPADCGACNPAQCAGGCEADEQCVAGVCTLACSGATVPGDYATIQGAINALAPVGGTICLVAASYTENLQVAPNAALTIQGRSRKATKLNGSVALSFSSGTGAVKLRGFGVTNGLSISDTDTNHPIELIALDIANANAGGSAHGVTITRDVRRPTVTISRCDVSGAAAASAVQITESADFPSLNGADVNVRDSYLHDSAFGLRYSRSGASNWGSFDIEVTNNTFLDNGAGLSVDSANQYVALQLRNNAFSGNDVASSLAVDTSFTLQQSNNAFGDNGVQFQSAAYATASDRIGPLGLDAATPPGPSASSILIGNANAQVDTGFDFFGRPRDSSPDIGAVERNCGQAACVAVGLPACGDGQCNGTETCQSCSADCGACNPAGCAGGCDADAACVAGICTVACTGALVPQHYATIQGAINALSPVGGTICVGAGTFVENLNIAPAAALTIQGRSRTATSLNGQVTFQFSSGTGPVALRSMTVANGVSVLDTDSNHPIELRALNVSRSASGANAHGIEVRRDVRRPAVNVDRVNAMGAAGAAALAIVESADFTSLNGASLTATNSFFHDSGFGIRYFESSASNWGTFSLFLSNNTILDNDTGVSVESSNQYVSLALSNSAIGDNTLGLRLLTDSSFVLSQSNNAYGGNGTHFDGTAYASTSDLFGPLALDAAVPPGPGASSLLIGAAKVSAAPSADFFGRARDATPDVGAVERSCAQSPCVAVGAPTCGDGACNGAENCQTCAADCGACSAAGCPGGCEADAQCVAGICSVACVGARVPGDYATIQGAINALSPVGGTICVAAGTFAENLAISPAAALTIQGRSRGATTLNGSATFSFSSGTGQVELRAMTVQNGVSIADTDTNHPIKLTALNVRRTATGANAHAVEVRRDVRRPTVTIDRADLAGATAAAALAVVESADFSSLNSASLAVRDSYLHDSAFGFRFFESSASNFGSFNLAVVNNTVLDNGVGVVIEASNVYVAAEIHNNAVGENSTGLSLQIDSSVTVSQSSNAYGGNGVNFQGAAFASATDRFGALGLDASTPPSPTAASILVAGANGLKDTGVDFRGGSRDATPDIGAVERVCSPGPCVPQGQPACGDGACNGVETCQTCASDCGACNPGSCAGGCEADEQCVAGACVLACSGVKVPGDYGTVQAAINALGPVGGTICLAPGTFAETLLLAPQAALTLQGASRKSTLITGTIQIQFSSGNGAIEVRGLTAQDGISVLDSDTNHQIKLTSLNVRRSSTGVNAPGLLVRRDVRRPQVYVDRCDIAGATAAAAISVVESADFSSLSKAIVQVRDSFLHDSAVGLSYSKSGASNWGDFTVSSFNSTILDNEKGVAVSAGNQYLTLQLFNNVFAENGVGAELGLDSSVTWQHGKNAYDGNGVNFKGQAVSVSGDIRGDVALDFAGTPPGPAANSPLLGAADGTKDSGVDFFGRQRDASPDIGAVERICAGAPCVAVNPPGCGDGVCVAPENCGSCSADCGACNAAACGGACRNDQLCIAGQCEFVCSGYDIPGDYDTPQEAANAVGPYGGTLCLRGSVYSGGLALAPQAALEVRGRSMDLTSFSGNVSVSFSSGSGAITLLGFEAPSGLTIVDTDSNHPVVLRALRIFHGGSASAHGLVVQRDVRRPDVRADGCDISADANAFAVRLVESADFSSLNGWSFVLHSSYVHDCAVGVGFLESGAANFGTSYVQLANNTLVDNGTALSVNSSNNYLTLQFFNNAFLESTLGVSLSLDSSALVAFGNNALFGNGTNYAGSAVPGAGYVTSDPLLDWTKVPPAPTLASPLRGAANAGSAPALDYWGRPRVGVADIGAVEGP
jgi:hypothetical protein